MMRPLLAAAALIAASPALAAPDIRVAKRCAGAARCFATLGEALSQAGRDADTGWTTIRIAPGTYREKVTVARGRTRLVGGGAATTKLVFDAVAQTAGRYHRAGWGTPGSATLTIDAADVVVSALTVENDYDYLANDRRAAGGGTRIANPQAVALLADVDSDRVSIRDSAILGYQDSFFANGKRVHVANSLIAGNIDFIFGNGTVLIEASEIRSRVRAGDTRGEAFQSFVAAPSTPRAAGRHRHLPLAPDARGGRPRRRGRAGTAVASDDAVCRRAPCRSRCGRAGVVHRLPDGRAHRARPLDQHERHRARRHQDRRVPRAGLALLGTGIDRPGRPAARDRDAGDRAGRHQGHPGDCV